METPTVDLIKPLVTLVANVNPLAIVPFFIHYPQGCSPNDTISNALNPAVAPTR